MLQYLQQKGIHFIKKIGHGFTYFLKVFPNFHDKLQFFEAQITLKCNIIILKSH